MADIIDEKQTEITRITGKDELHPVDSLRVNNINKLWNKSNVESELLEKLDELIKAIHLNRHTKNQIVDGIGTGLKNKINKFNALKVYSQGIPDTDDPTILVPKSGFLTDDNGAIEAAVDGSVNPVDFSINAVQDNDIYISAISFKLADANSVLNRFGNLPELTNGLQLIYKNDDLGERVLIDSIKTNFDLVRVCQGNPPFSSDFRATNVTGNSEGYLPVLKIDDVFNLPFGIRLKANTLDKLIIRVNDNITGIDSLDIFYYGSEFINKE